jgi:hypothetical protein
VTTPEEHDARVRDVAAQVRALLATRQPAHIDKGGVHHVVPLAGADGRFAGRRIDVGALHHLIQLDVARRRCVVEPGITFRDLVAATLPAKPSVRRTRRRPHASSPSPRRSGGTSPRPRASWSRLAG